MYFVGIESDKSAGRLDLSLFLWEKEEKRIAK
jgi:hypothetical protein